MNEAISSYFQESPGGASSRSSHFHKVTQLQRASDISWEVIHEKFPVLPKGWFELAHLSSSDKIEFVREHWFAKLPHLPHGHDFLITFFAGLEDIGIFITQTIKDAPFQARLVYALKGGAGFYHGFPGASPERIVLLQEEFPKFSLPADYLAFLGIHNGFSKSTDTGVSPAEGLRAQYSNFQRFVSDKNLPLLGNGEPIDIRSLIPYYESFGLRCYHCFFADWYPEQEMGNIYYSGIEHTISDFKDPAMWVENLAFSTFLDWLAFYLEGMD